MREPHPDIADIFSPDHAERLLRGVAPAADDPPSYARVHQIVAAARGSAEDHELAQAARAVDVFSAVRASARASTDACDNRVKVIAGKVLAILGIATGACLGAALATGAIDVPLIVPPRVHDEPRPTDPVDHRGLVATPSGPDTVHSSDPSTSTAPTGVQPAVAVPSTAPSPPPEHGDPQGSGRHAGSAPGPAHAVPAATAPRHVEPRPSAGGPAGTAGNAPGTGPAQVGGHQPADVPSQSGESSARSVPVQAGATPAATVSDQSAAIPSPAMTTTPAEAGEGASASGKGPPGGK